MTSLSRESLRSLYLDKGMSIPQISSACKISRYKVYALMREWGIPRRGLQAGYACPGELTPMAQVILDALEEANSGPRSRTPSVSLPGGSREDLCVALALASREYVSRYPKVCPGYIGSSGRLSFSAAASRVLGLSRRMVQYLAKDGREILRGQYRQPKKYKSTESVLYDAEIRELESVWSSTEAELASVRKERDELQFEVRRQSALVEHLQGALDERQSNVGRTPRFILTGPSSPTECLEAVVAAYSDRAVVLDSAFSSAKKSEAFRHVGKLAQLLEKLVTVYYEAMAEGRGDTEAYAHMGWGYAAKNNINGNVQIRRAHTFRYKGQDVLMEKHLRIGTKASVSETIRVHFEWLASDKVLVIGWCGPHLV